MNMGMRAEAFRFSYGRTRCDGSGAGGHVSVYTVTYDAWNRLVEVTSGGNVVVKNEYDGLNRRIEQHINPDYNDNTYDQYRHFYYNNKWQVLETRVTTAENTQPEDASVKPEWQFVWSLRYIDSPICRDENKDADGDCVDGNDERLYYLTDANMNVTTLVDTGGDAVERYVYDAYGEVRIYEGDWSAAQSADTYSNTILYAGYWRDSRTGLACVRNRYYHPALGRWLQRDPAGYVDGMSLYEYVGSGPTVQYDGDGLSASSSSRVVLAMTVARCQQCVDRILRGGTTSSVPGNTARLYRMAREKKDRWGIPCVGKVRCVDQKTDSHCRWYRKHSTLTQSAAGGMHRRWSRNIYICVVWKMADWDIEQHLHHELTHAYRLCGRDMTSCEDCMIEEKKAWFFANQCTTNCDCTAKAMTSCKGAGKCALGENYEDYLGT